MPVYCYTCENCAKTTEDYRHKAEDRNQALMCPKCAHSAWRNRPAEGFNSTQVEWHKPLVSDSMSVGGNPAAVDACRRRNPDIKITDWGQPVLHSLHERRKFEKREGLTDLRSY